MGARGTYCGAGDPETAVDSDIAAAPLCEHKVIGRSRGELVGERMKETLRAGPRGWVGGGSAPAPLRNRCDAVRPVPGLTAAAAGLEQASRGTGLGPAADGRDARGLARVAGVASDCFRRRPLSICDPRDTQVLRRISQHAYGASDYFRTEVPAAPRRCLSGGASPRPRPGLAVLECRRGSPAGAHWRSRLGIELG